MQDEVKIWLTSTLLVLLYQPSPIIRFKECFPANLCQVGTTMIKPSLWEYIEEIVDDEAEFIQIKDIILEYDCSTQDNEVLLLERESLRSILKDMSNSKSSSVVDSSLVGVEHPNPPMNFVEWQCKENLKEISNLVDTLNDFEDGDKLVIQLFESFQMAHWHFQNHIINSNGAENSKEEALQQIESSKNVDRHIEPNYYSLIDSVKHELNISGIFQSIDIVCEAFREESQLLMEEVSNLRSYIDHNNSKQQRKQKYGSKNYLDLNSLKEIKTLRLELGEIIRGKESERKNDKRLPPLIKAVSFDEKENEMILPKKSTTKQSSRKRKTLLKALDDAANLKI